MSDVTIDYKGSVIASMDTSGSKTLKTSGTYCEGDVTVRYEKPEGVLNCKRYVLTLSSDISGQWISFNPGGDADLAAHREDDTMHVSWFRTADYPDGKASLMFHGG